MNYFTKKYRHYDIKESSVSIIIERFLVPLVSSKYRDTIIKTRATGRRVATIITDIMSKADE